MKYEVSETFIKEAFGAACETWKGKIKKEFPELFEVKLETGRWYKNLTWEGSYMLYNGIEKEGNFKCVGVTYTGEWCKDGAWGINEGYVLATEEEIEIMLWREAKKRGIEKGTKLEECLWHIDNHEIQNKGNMTCHYYIASDGLWNKNGCIYKQGEWAVPLNENKEIQEKIDTLQKQLDELKLKVK